MSLLSNPHPGTVLRERFLEPQQITPYRLAQDIMVPQSRITAILQGKRRLTSDTALRLGRYFDNSPKFWLDLQDHHDLIQGLRENREFLRVIRRVSVDMHVKEQKVA